MLLFSLVIVEPGHWPASLKRKTKTKYYSSLFVVEAGQCVQIQIQRQCCQHRYVLLFSLVIVEPGQGVYGRMLAIIRGLSEKFYEAGIQLPSEGLNVLLFPLVIVGSDQRVQMSAGNLFKFCCRSEYCTE